MERITLNTRAINIAAITAMIVVFAQPASAVVYCKYIGVPKGCVARPGVVLRPAPGVPGEVVVAPGAAVAPVTATPGAVVAPRGVVHAPAYSSSVTTVQGAAGGAAYNPRTGNAAVSHTNANGVTTTQTARGGEAKTKNGMGVAQAPGGKTCVKGRSQAKCN